MNAPDCATDLVETSGSSQPVREALDELLAEAEGLVDSALVRAYALRRDGCADDAGQLLRSVHSCKSLVALAERTDAAALAGRLEDYIQAIWQGKILPEEADHDLVHRALLQLRNECGLDLVASEAVPLLLAGLERALTEGTSRQTSERESASAMPEPPNPDAGLLGVRLSLNQLTELHDQSAGLVRMARLLYEQSSADESRQSELVQALLLSADRLEVELRRHVRQNLRAYLLPLVGAMQTMAAGQGKQVSIRLEAPDLSLQRPFLQALRPSLLHLVRNAVAHGIESPEKRAAAGKSPQGRIVVSAEVTDSHLYLRVSDDGQGFDADALRRAAEESGALSPNGAEGRDADDLLSLALIPGLSTTATPDDYSGRGLGLTVVGEDVASLGGRITLETAPGQSSQISLQVPLPR